MATTILQSAKTNTLAAGANRLPVPWRDPQSVSPAELAKVIAALEQACAQNPASADLRTCLGMAHAMNYDPERSMDALEEARGLEPDNFLAQFKYAELHYRLRALEVAENETQRALHLASSQWELAMARRQLSEIRRLKREGTQKPTWTKSLVFPAVALVVMMAVVTCLSWAYR
jgi:cytochrome c-type biogenesis protein CcmH/NrfG